jgi:hypothetical protein
LFRFSSDKIHAGTPPPHTHTYRISYDSRYPHTGYGLLLDPTMGAPQVLK